MNKSYFAHETAVIDSDCSIGEGTKIWHFSHIMSNSILGKSCNLGQNVVISPNVVLGNNVKVQNNVSIYTGANSNDTVFVATTTRAGVTNTIEVEKWKLEGKVSTSFSFIEKVNYDRGNGKQYRQSSVVFNGAKLTITIYELISKKKLD